MNVLPVSPPKVEVETEQKQCQPLLFTNAPVIPLLNNETEEPISYLCVNILLGDLPEASGSH